MTNAATPRDNSVAGKFQECGGSRSAPLWVGGRKVAADVSLSQRAENGIGQRVQGNVSVAMAASAFIMRNGNRSEEHTSELQSLMRISYAVFCLKKKRLKIHT